jgi:hypothetical protein
VVTVRNADGEPVEDVRVAAEVEAGLTYSGWEGWSAPNDYQETGPDGRARLFDLARGAPYRLTVTPARWSGCGPVRIDAWKPADREVTLPVGLTVSGRILGPDGAPFASGDPDGQMWSWGRCRGWDPIGVDEDGRFSESGFAAGKVALVWVPLEDDPWEEPELEPADVTWPVRWVDAGTEAIVFRIP